MYSCKPKIAISNRGPLVHRHTHTHGVDAGFGFGRTPKAQEWRRLEYEGRPRGGVKMTIYTQLLSSRNKQPEIANVGNSCLILGLHILKSKTYLKQSKRPALSDLFLQVK